MTFALSTNWCNRRLAAGEEIADLARALGFDALELGFRTTDEQVAGFRRRLDRMPVGSVHAFCPVPLSAPCGHPELYSLADPDEEAYRMARLQVERNIAFASDLGADALVLHAGRVPCASLFASRRLPKRRKAGARLLEVFRRRLDALTPVLERFRVTLGLENLPYLEGFPDADEMAALAGPWVKTWFDTGHDYVRRVTLGLAESAPTEALGLHLNDSTGGDDHLAPGTGKVDFAVLAPLATAARHRVFEPNESVTAEELGRGLAHLRRLWCSSD